MKRNRVKKCLGLAMLMAAVSLPAFAVESSLTTIPESQAAAVTLRPSPTIDFSLNETEAGERIGGGSQAKAVWYSLLLPGLGDYYLGNTTRAKAFFIAEAAVWTSFIVFEVQGYLREDGYKDFAITFGGVNGSDYSDDYYRILSQYNSIEEYEEAIKKEGRYELYPNSDYTALQNYYLSQRISDIEPWEWPSDEKRWEYRSIRKGSRQAKRRAMYSIAAGVANRIVSSLFALKSARDLSSDNVSADGRYHLQFGHPCMDFRDPLRTGVTIVRTF
jgi:hypothetical protein